MPVFSRVISIFLRIGEIAFGAIVAGIVGWYLHKYDSSDSWPHGRWIYSEVIAGLSILLGLLWLIPFAWSFFVWPLDVILGLAWFAVFGVQVNALHHSSCWSGPWDIIRNKHTYYSYDSDCARWKASEAFSFLSACFWLASGLVGIWFTLRVRTGRSVDAVPARRRWYRRSYV